MTSLFYYYYWYHITNIMLYFYDKDFIKKSAKTPYTERKKYIHIYKQKKI